MSTDKLVPVDGKENRALTMLINHLVMGMKIHPEEQEFIDVELSGMAPKELAQAMLFGFKTEGIKTTITPTIEKSFGRN